MREKTYVIAEAGVNHNGSLELALQLVDEAAKAGADAVKFQTFQADKLVVRTAKKADYQLQTTDSRESQWEMLKKLELSSDDHTELVNYCKEKGIQFLSTPFDLDSLDLLTSYNLPYLKISSGDLTNSLLLLKAARSGTRIILSTGMSTLAEIEKALSVLAFGFLHADQKPSSEAFYQAYCSSEGQKILNEKVTLLHCTTEYPTPFSEVNLRVMDTLRETFGLPVGLSDHTQGIAVPIAAVARGAAVIEKHFTLDKNLPGPDHKASLNPEEMAEMIQGIRQIEEALGSPRKVPTRSETKNMNVARKSLAAAVPIKKGEIFTEENLTVKRPGEGISSIHYWDWIGSRANRDYQADEFIRIGE